MKNLAEGVRWDLGDLYASTDDPRIEKDIEEASRLAKDFEKTYKPLFAGLQAHPQSVISFPLEKLLAEYKHLVTLMTRPIVYAQLKFSEKTDAPGIGAFLQGIRVKLTDIESHLTFLQVAWNELEAGAANKLMERQTIRPDRHYLEHLRIYAPHTLKENEEKILSKKNLTAGSAFSRLFDEVIGRLRFTIELDGKLTQKSEEEILAYLHAPDRALRQKAMKSLGEGLGAQAHLLTYIYNMILADHRADLQMRHYPHPMTPRNLSNETTLECVRGLIQEVKAAYPLVQRYYQLKKRLLGLDQLFDYDRYAPIETHQTLVPFSQCREWVLEAYNRFSPEAGRIAAEFFDKKWIDAELRPGKQGGGFSCETTPDLHPYILVNYTGTHRDIMTVAHELGHGIHQYLSRKAGILESSTPLTMAETASVFGEMIVFGDLLKNTRSAKEKLALLMGKIDDNFATVFRQIAMTDFELQCHEAGEGELSEEDLNRFWLESNRALYGQSVTLTEDYRHGWKYIPHFVHTPFYCYAYAFAQLFVLSLYEIYLKNPATFLPKYFEMLSLGGSRKPEELASLFGIDLNDRNLWRLGLDLLEKLVKEAEDLAASEGL